MRTQAVLIIFLVLPLPIQAETPVFSIERNLVVWQQAAKKSFEFRKDLTPLDPAIAATCCTIEPGQTIAVVRGNQVAGTGRVATVIAGDVPKAGGDEMLYFTVTGMPDSLAIGDGPPLGMRNKYGYDLYVAGANQIRVLPPPSSPWSQPDSLRAMMPQLFADKVLIGRHFPGLHGDEAYTPDQAGAWWLDHRAMASGTIDVHGYERAQVLASVPAEGASCIDFVRVTAPEWHRAVNLRGKLDRMLDIDGVVYLVLVDCWPGTGMWKFQIHAVQPNGSTRIVHDDSSWST